MTKRTAVARSLKVAVVFALLAGCSENGESASPDPSSSTTTSTSAPVVSTTTTASACPEMTATVIPAGLTQKATQVQQSSHPPFGVNVSFEDDTATKGVSLLSGVFGEVTEGFPPAAERKSVQVRGHDAQVLMTSERYTAVWDEADPEKPCSQYAVSAYGITRDQFQQILAGIR